MEHTLSILTEISNILISVLVLVQVVVNYFLPPEKAEKYNYIGKVLDFLAKTKKGVGV